MRRKPESRVLVAATCKEGSQFSVALVLRGEQRVEKAFACKGEPVCLLETIKSSSVFDELNYCTAFFPGGEEFCEALDLPVVVLPGSDAERLEVLATGYCAEIAGAEKTRLV